MGRPRGEPTTVVRLPTRVVSRIDELRLGQTRAEYLDALLTSLERRPSERRGSPSPSLARFSR